MKKSNKLQFGLEKPKQVTIYLAFELQIKETEGIQKRTKSSRAQGASRRDTRRRKFRARSQPLGQEIAP